jgi:hypothetical protein
MPNDRCRKKFWKLDRYSQNRDQSSQHRGQGENSSIEIVKTPIWLSVIGYGVSILLVCLIAATVTISVGFILYIRASFPPDEGNKGEVKAIYNALESDFSLQENERILSIAFDGAYYYLHTFDPATSRRKIIVFNETRTEKIGSAQ